MRKRVGMSAGRSVNKTSGNRTEGRWRQVRCSPSALLSLSRSWWIGLIAWLAADYLVSQPVPDQQPVPAFVVRVPLPIVGDADQQIRSRLERELGRLPAGPARAVCVLEFAPGGENLGEGSQFERALAVARFLLSERMSRVRTVAYVPRGLRGHAVLVALACEELAMGQEAEFGPAGSDTELLDAAVKEAYRSIADRRRTVPAAVALALVDPAAEVYRVELLDGSTRYVSAEELAQLRRQATISKEETLSAAGDLLRLPARDMRLKYGFAAHLVNNRRELAGQLGVSPERLADTAQVEAQWSVARVEIRGRIHSELVTRTIRLIQDRLQRGENFLLLVHLDSPGGSPDDSIRLADFLAKLDDRRIRSCIYISGAARADAALIAMAADDLAMSAHAVLGGPGERNLTDRELVEVQGPIRAICSARERDWSIWYAMVDPKAQVFRCRREGTAEERLFSKEERQEQPDPDAWKMGDPLNTADGLTAAEATQLGLVRFPDADLEQIPRLYGIEGQVEVLEPGWFISRLERLAAQAWFSRTLLFLAFFGLMIEASTPGVGIPGFVSALCFLLFFWAQFLNGTAGWLEVLLFLGGLMCLLIELFVLPGFGIFGIGGALMMIASLVLASQTFVIPQNSYQMRQFPQSIYGVVMAALGTGIGLYVMRHYLPKAPWLRNLVLAPPQQIVEDLDRREALVDFSHLLNKVGVATTLLAPSGKAAFGEELVDVITSGQMVRAGTPVRVVDVRGNRVEVEPLDGS
ncbi:MAG: nodulation protein NfeD [Pirellulaceae bacterium]|nr:MAG: nodulation protein NfeD [Pirellulaceae bacterium]GIW92710.1 MAG: nodulation protein NfeD [Pirellulaceae bacterium]